MLYFQFRPLWLAVLAVLSVLPFLGGCRELPVEEAEQREELFGETGVFHDSGLVQHPLQAIEPQVDWRASSVEHAPMTLTASDGSGLELVSLTGSVVLEDPLALTELHLTFENPEARRREGRFAFDLPEGAALSRLAMKVDGKWMEGEVVERAKGQRTFETYLHWRPRVDPALMEKASANRVSARVFPLLPHERKEIIVAYSQPLRATGAAVHSDERYRLPLSGLPKLEELDLRFVVGGAPQPERGDGPRAHRVLEVVEHDFQPRRDLVVALEGSLDAAAQRSDDLVALRVRPDLREAPAPLEGLTILFDTSASSARAHDREVDRLAALLEHLGERPVRLVAFDQEVEAIHEGPAREAIGEPLKRLRDRRAYGASDFEKALRAPMLRDAVGGRLLVWSDGIATAGEVNSARLREQASSLGLERVDAYASRASANRSALTQLARAGERAGVVIGPDLPGPELSAALERPGFDQVQVAVEGAVWSYPRQLDGFTPGEDLVVFARFDGPAPERVRVGFDDTRLPDHLVTTRPGADPLLERAAARARIAELNRELADALPSEQGALKAKITRIALEQRLLTEFTALLVLESEAEYRRYGIGRHARANILSAGPGGVEIIDRGRRRPAVAPEAAVASIATDHQGEEGKMGKPTRAPDRSGFNYAPELSARNAGILGVMEQEKGHFLASPYGGFAVGNDDEDIWGGLTGTEIGEAYGIGGLGLVGQGRGGGGTGEGTIGLGNQGLIGKGGGGGVGSGYGRGSGAGFGGRGKRMPRVRQAKAQVSGALDKDIIRRIVRAHINEVRACYNGGLTRNPNLEGRVEISFTISPTGKVSLSEVSRSSLGDNAVSNCIAKAVHRWKFPKPRGGGLVIVRYPFVMSPGGSGGLLDLSGTSSGRTRFQRRPGDPSDPHGARWRGSAQTGRYGQIQQLIAKGETQAAHDDARAWAQSEPDNLVALIALGESLEQQKDDAQAARVYGSIIDLFPHRPEMRRTAAERLDALGDDARPLAVDSFEKAVAQRPDQLNGYRLLAWAQAKAGDYEAAYETLSTAIDYPAPSGRFRGVKSLLREDRRLLAAAWLARNPGPEVEARLRAAGVRPATQASLRVVASWETDATDVDILVDPIGRGDGKRHADVRTGFGPEAWISLGSTPPNAVQARVRYFSRGAMGHATGTVTSIRHDGEGHLRFEAKPFVLMNSRGSVEIGRLGDAS